MHRRSWIRCISRPQQTCPEVHAEQIDRGHLGRILQLTLLAPDIVEAILDERQPADLGLPSLMEAFPAD